MKVKHIDHIGIAVSSIDSTLKLYKDVLGLKFKGFELMEEQKVKTAIIAVGESEIELLEPTDSQGAIAKHLEKRGEGLHHLALEVSNIHEALETLEKKEILLIDKKPRTGVEDTSIAFLHPKGTKVLMELVEPRK